MTQEESGRGPVPYYAGIPTYLGAQSGEPDDLRSGDVAVWGVPWDISVGTRPGARYAPRAVRAESLNFIGNLEYVDRTVVEMDTGREFTFKKAASAQDEKSRLVDLGDIPVFPLDVGRTERSIGDFMRRVLEKGAFPIVLGGDHYVTWPLVRSFCETNLKRDPNFKMGFVQFDAHLDLYASHDILGDCGHGSGSRKIAGLPCVSHMAWVGLNGFVAKEPLEFARSRGVHIFTADDVRSRGAEKVTAEALAIAGQGTSAVYVTIDIDVCDAACAPGTGSYNFGGISSAELLSAVRVLGDSEYIKALDFVEVAPNLDQSGMTARLAATAINRFLMPKIFPSQGACPLDPLVKDINKRDT